MRLFIAICLICSFVCACNNASVSPPMKQDKRKKTVVIKTPEIVRILRAVA